MESDEAVYGIHDCLKTTLMPPYNLSAESVPNSCSQYSGVARRVLSPNEKI